MNRMKENDEALPRSFWRNYPPAPIFKKASANKEPRWRRPCRSPDHWLVSPAANYSLPDCISASACRQSSKSDPSCPPRCK